VSSSIFLQVKQTKVAVANVIIPALRQRELFPVTLSAIKGDHVATWNEKKETH